MRILFLTQIIPFPPDAGPKVKTWHVLRALKRFGYDITLVSFMRDEEAEHVPRLTEVCEAVYPIPLRRSRLLDLVYWLRSMLTRRPFIVERDDLRAMRARVLELVETGSFDVIHADQLTMAQFALPPGLDRRWTKEREWRWPHTIFDAHNAVWTIMDRLAETAHPLLKPVLNLEKRRVRDYEGRLIHHFDLTLAVIDPDRRALLEAGKFSNGSKPPEISVIPIAVDADQLMPADRPASSTNILTLGTLHYPPNADGIRWFLNEVFPLVKSKVDDVTLTIVGKNPPKDFQEAAANSPGTIDVTGYVAELDPYFDRAAVFVVPVRAGGGMRVRILEAFARGMPVVTTTIGLEGIEAEHGKHVIVADSPLAFADWVQKLLEHPQLRHELSVAARQLAEARYDWKSVLNELHNVYENLGENQVQKNPRQNEA